MKYKIKKGKHRACPPTIALYIKKKYLGRSVVFDSSCRYDLGDVDQHDINKLFGIGYFPHHHRNSARFGWTYDIQSDKILLHVYCYVNKKKINKELMRVPLMEKIHCSITVSKDSYIFQISTGEVLFTERVEVGDTKSFGYGLGPYFGGNEKATHDMYITLDK